MKIRIFSTLLLFTLISGLIGRSVVYANEENHKIVGYIQGWTMARVPLSEIRLEQTTHLIYSGVKVASSTDPTIVSSWGWEYIAQCVDAGHAKGIKVFIGLESTPKSNYLSDVVHSPSLLNTLVDNIKNMLLTYNADGIDIDWETGEPQSDMNLLLDAIYPVLHPLGKEVSMAASWYRYDIGLTQANNSIDLIMVMTYDMWSPHPLPYNSTFEDSVAAMNMWIDGGYPKEKLLMGIPFYGKDNNGTVAIYGNIVDALNPTSDQNQANITSILGWGNVTNTVD